MGQVSPFHLVRVFIHHLLVCLARYRRADGISRKRRLRRWIHDWIADWRFADVSRKEECEIQSLRLWELSPLGFEEIKGHDLLMELRLPSKSGSYCYGWLLTNYLLLLARQALRFYLNRGYPSEGIPDTAMYYHLQLKWNPKDPDGLNNPNISSKVGIYPYLISHDYFNSHCRSTYHI